MLSDMDGTNSMFSHWLSKAADIRHKADNLRMRSFGPELLRAISIAYKQSLQIYCGRQSKIKRNNIWNIKDRDRIRSAIEKVEMYQAKLRMVTDGDEQRTLQEDITGKVLQACWYGVRAEVETLLAKVMDNIVNDKEVSAGMRWARAERLKNIGMIMEDVIEGAPDNGNCPLRRITADAEAEVSKHDLFLEQKARTAEAAVEGQPTNNTNPS
ncbi:X-domain of DnaJ-containing-domain-containing protein [Scleroderma citrinum]